MIDYEDHKERHDKLHHSLDELVADFITHTGKRPSESTVMELIQWSAQQKREPSVLVERGEVPDPGAETENERRMHLATRLESMGYQLHAPHKGWLITQISSVDSSPTLDGVETLVEQLEKRG